MSHLPENIDNWPTDPWLLIGVAADASSRTIRNAYAKMLKEYRPEINPAAFQKIRAAYEVLMSWTRETEVPHAEFQLDCEVDRAINLHGNPSAIDSSESIKISLDRVLERIAQGDLQPALKDLEGMVRRNPADDESRVRLCWLRYLADSPVAGFDPIHDLLEGNSPPISFSIWRTVIQSLELRPELALLHGLDVWLRQRIPQSLLQRVVHHRWRAAATRQEYSQIERDWELLKPYASNDTIGDWLALVLELQRILCWHSDDSVKPWHRRIREEFEEHVDDSLTFSGLYDEHEWRRSVRDSLVLTVWRTWAVTDNHSLARDWLEYLRRIELGQLEMARSMFEEIVAQWAEDAEYALAMVDEFFRRNGDLAYAVHFYVNQTPCLFAPSSQINDRIQREFWHEFPITEKDFVALRARTLSFCVSEALELEYLVDFMQSEDCRIPNRSFVLDVISGDRSLGFAIDCVRRYWEFQGA